MTQTWIHLKDTEFSTKCGMLTKDITPSELATDPKEAGWSLCWECGMVHSNETAPPAIKANIIVGEGQPAIPHEVVNAPNSWDKLYVLSVLSGGSYLVSACSMDDAFDEWVDYCEDRGYRGLVAQDPVRAGWLTQEEFQESLDKEETPPDMAIGGNHGLYYTSPDLHCYELTSDETDIETANAILFFESSGQDYFGNNPSWERKCPTFGWNEEEFLSSLAADLKAESERINPYDEIDEDEVSPGDESEGFRDVRLYLRPNLSFELNTGLSDYDQDHRGWCGASMVSRPFRCVYVGAPEDKDQTWEALPASDHKDTAKELLEQVLDSLYQSKPSWLEVK